MIAIHRGFFTYQDSAFRNDPKWEIPIKLKELVQDIPIICDPSHISGNRDLIHEVSQKAIDMVNVLDHHAANRFLDVRESYREILARIHQLGQNFDKVELIHINSHQAVNCPTRALNAKADLLASLARDRAIRLLRDLGRGAL